MSATQTWDDHGLLYVHNESKRVDLQLRTVVSMDSYIRNLLSG